MSNPGFLSQWSFKAKLIGLCLCLGFISVIIGGLSYRGLHKVEETYDKIPDQVMPKLQSANEMFVLFRRVRIMLRTLGLPGITPDAVKESVDGALQAIADFEMAEKAYLSLPMEDGQKERYEEVRSHWVTFKGVGQRILELQKTGTPEDHERMVKMFFKECPETAKLFSASMQSLLAFHKARAAAAVAVAKKTSDDTNVLILLVGAIGIISGVSLGVVFAASISKTIVHVTASLSQSVEQVASASTQVASSSQELSHAATEQAASLQETASSLEQITAMIEKASASAGATATRSGESQSKAEEGRLAVAQMLESMNEISHSNGEIMLQVGQSNHQMEDIVRLIHDIGSKTQVINEIVFQTKLLSFNASVEAARAGEHGKGFAVVAEEVGSLAQMSGNAAKEITTMLDASIAKVESIVRESKTKIEVLFDQSKVKVESGVQVAEQCSGLLEAIVADVSQVSALALEISQATKEQAQGVTEINRAMGQLDTVTQQNTATSQQTAGAAEELSNQGESLKMAVTELEEIVRGSRYVA